jgi:HAMP domain-containing protein
MNNSVIKRRSVFIKKHFQGQFIAGAFALILLSGACSALLIYWITGGDLQAQSQSAHTNIVNAWERLGVSIMLGNLVSIVVAGTVAVISVLYASHKIAGPLYRFETLCREIGNGNFDTETHLREHDQLQELAQSFKVMVTKLRRRREMRNQLVDESNQHLAFLAASDNLSEEQRNRLMALAESMEQLRLSESMSFE